MRTEAEKLIEEFQMIPHTEGGYYRETYRSEESIKNSCLPVRYSGERCFATAIYYLLKSAQVSYFHKIKSDEIWHFYLGSPIILHCLNEFVGYNKIIIGNKVLEGEVPQYIIRKGIWFAAEVMDENSFSLVGCTVSPGFDYHDFTLADRNDLINLFPEHRELVERFTK